MIRATDISVIFHPNTIQGSRSLGYGQINILGIMISFTLYPSNFGLGFMVSYPSKPSIKNGVQELDANGKPKYFKEVYIQNIELRNMIDNAVQNAMANKGVYVGQPAPQQQQANYQQPQTGFTPPAQTSFASPAAFTPPPVTQQNAPAAFVPPPVVNPVNQPLTTVYQQNNVNPSAVTTPTANPGGYSTVQDDDLPL